MPVSGVNLVAKNITAFGGGFTKQVNDTMKEVKKIIDKQVTKNISNEDHSLSDLARLDHPYAKRHGDKGLEIHDPYWKVHKQSGKLLSSKRSGTDNANIASGKLQASAYVYLDKDIAPHAEWVVYGNSKKAPKMIARPVMKGSLEEVRGEVFKEIETNLRDLVHNFKAV